MIAVISRRRFLSCTILASGGVMASTSAARAFSIEEPAASLVVEYHAARAAACSSATSAFHTRVLTEVRAALAGQQLSEAERQQVLAQTTCPICGCPIAGS
jgi:prolyl-tRNA editing enzyme YbaK/EbsC (Cys-tRNA(Pro) deacylase)